MKTHFVISDIHSFADELKIGLKEAGFRKSNKEHILVCLGDIFDRGSGTLEVFKYFKSIPKNRRILIKGNHEYLFLSLLEKEYPDSFDFTNGTVKTFCAIANIDEEAFLYTCFAVYSWGKKIPEMAVNIWNDIKERVAKSAITKWLKSDEWLDYYELNDYIFVHSFVPLAVRSPFEATYLWTARSGALEMAVANPNWRLADRNAWEAATWGCPWKFYKAGLFDTEIKNNKILVCGHWHTSDFYKNLDHCEVPNNEIYFSKNLIGLDACTALTKRINVLVIKDNKCYIILNNKLASLEDIIYE